jgi:hypothetical protein
VDREQLHHVLLAVLAGPAADWLSRGVSPGAASMRERAFARRYMERTDGSDDWSTAWRLIEEIHPLDPLAVARAIPDTEWAGATPEDLTARYGRPAIEAHQGRIAEELERIAVRRSSSSRRNGFMWSPSPRRCSAGARSLAKRWRESSKGSKRGSRPGRR